MNNKFVHHIVRDAPFAPAALFWVSLGLILLLYDVLTGRDNFGYQRKGFDKLA